MTRFFIIPYLQQAKLKSLKRFQLNGGISARYYCVKYNVN